jgi:hypothetical protein
VFFLRNVPRAVEFLRQWFANAQKDESSDQHSLRHTMLIFINDTRRQPPYYAGECKTRAKLYELCEPYAPSSAPYDCPDIFVKNLEDMAGVVHEPKSLPEVDLGDLGEITQVGPFRFLRPNLKPALQSMAFDLWTSRFLITETSSAGIFVYGWHLMLHLDEWSKAANHRDSLASQRRFRSANLDATTVQGTASEPLDGSDEFGSAATWLMSTFHPSQMGIVLVFGMDPSVRLPSWALPCGKRLVSPIDRVCLYVVDAGDLEQGLGGFDLLTDGSHSSYVAAAVVWDLELLSAMGIDWEELIGALPSFARILLSDAAQRALPQLAAPRLSAVGKRAYSAPWVVYNVGSMRQGPFVELRLEPAARPISSADLVHGVCEVHFDEGTDSTVDSFLCVGVWGYMSQTTALLQCSKAGAHLLAFSHTLPYGTAALGCMLFDIALFEAAIGDQLVTSPPKVAALIETWLPGLRTAPHPQADVDRSRVDVARSWADVAGSSSDVAGSWADVARSWAEVARSWADVARSWVLGRCG